MGDAPRILFGNCFNSTDQELSFHGASQDLFYFDITSQVPEQLSGHVVSSMEAQARWYVKLLQAWKEAKLAPETPEQASRLVIQTLEMADVEGILKFYGLPIPSDLVEMPAVVVFHPPRAEGVKFVLQTLRIVCFRICGGDCLTVFVDAADPREVLNVPNIVQVSLSQRLKASAILAKRYREAMLKKGCAWYGVALDQRPEFTKARAAGVGLWALPNPEKPGECRNKNPEMPWDWRIPIISKRTC
ncbi:hypothetical protein MKW94_018802 [Papaver nudicaule]|uniref:Uncharacterized protein n=1 Tax=Papaver nudicaule TaxID=74823 RepID=A0AA41W1J7_PAPNU|nr:hypothetical protein [Papaver nudicaule]